VKLLKQRADRDFNSSTSAYGNLIKVIPSKERQLINITRQQEIKSALFTYLLERREEAAISAAGKLSDLRMIEFPRSNGIVSPKPLIVHLGSILLLVLMVLGVLYIKSALNNKITNKADIEERTALPVLGEIMEVETDSPLVMKEGNRSLIAEQFRGLRTSLGYMGDGSGKNKILVSSSIPSEGKSFVSTNIAISYALTGQKTVLIESDLRKPNIAKHFDISKRIGLSTYLNGNSTLEDIVIPTHIDNLYVIAAGPIPPNPVELMMNGKYQHLIEQLGELYYHVVIDCPPIGLVTDAEILGKWVDACVFIVRHQHTPKQAISNLLDRLYKGDKFNRMAIVMFEGRYQRLWLRIWIWEWLWLWVRLWLWKLWRIRLWLLWQ
jgi:capsular exopolysaccharide synthesis family protein